MKEILLDYILCLLIINPICLTVYLLYGEDAAMYSVPFAVLFALLIMTLLPKKEG